jgi:hypothetical protein
MNKNDVGETSWKKFPPHPLQELASSKSAYILKVFEDSKETFFQKVSLVGFGAKPQLPPLLLRP